MYNISKLKIQVFLLYSATRKIREAAERDKHHSPFQEERGGVSEFLHEYAKLASEFLLPLTASAEAHNWSSDISSGVSLTDNAWIFWLKFSILVVPGIGQTSFPWWWTQASASCEGVHPFLWAILFTRSNISAFCSRFPGWYLGKFCKSHSSFRSKNA